MKKILSLAFASVLLASCGKETVIKEVLVTTPPTEAPATSEPEANKYDQYLAFVNDNSAQSRQWTDADLLEMATLVCGAFDGGASLAAVIEIFSNNSEGRYDDELYAAIIGGSVTYLCPEWQSYVNSQI